MKKIISISLLLTILFANCLKINTPGGIVVWGTNKIVTQTLDIQLFNQLIIGDKFHAAIKQGETYSIQVKTNKNLVDFLQIEKKWNILSIEMKPNHFYKDAVLEVDITMPQLEYMDINGMSTVEIQQFNANNLQVDITEASELMGNISATNLDVDIKNGSGANLSGNVSFLKLEGTVGAKIDFGELAVGRANIYLSVGSEGHFQINDIVNAGIKNGSMLTYSGNAIEGNILRDESSQLVKK